MAYLMRTGRPEAGNKYYIRKADGGYSTAVKGNPTDSSCNVLSNCVGYAYGRFNEIGSYGSCKYLQPVNAERFMEFADGCKTGQTPKVGAVMVWQKGATLNASDGAGHVAIVERVDSATQVLTSESAWGNKTPFFTKTRVKGSDGRWGQDKNFKFLGFIYNPAVTDKGDVANAKYNLSAGLYGTHVKELQNTLVTLGYMKKTQVNSKYDDTTTLAVKAVQKKHNVTQNGIVTPTIWNFLTADLKAAMTSPSKFPYMVRVIVSALNYRAGAGTNYKINGCITDKGSYTIVAEQKDSLGRTWGKLKSGAGWICLTNYTKKV